MIKEEKEFFQIFNIFKKINHIKSKINKDDFEKINITKKSNNEFKKDDTVILSKNKFFITYSIFSNFIFYFFFNYNNNIKDFFYNFLNESISNTILVFLYFIITILFSSTIFIFSYSIFNYFKIFILKFKNKYHYKEKEHNKIDLFNSIIYFSNNFKTDNLDINESILLFSKEEIEIIEKHEIDLFNNDKILTNIINFLNTNIINNTENFNYNDFNEEINYLISLEKENQELFLNIKKEEFDNIKLVANLNKNKKYTDKNNINKALALNF